MATKKKEQAAKKKAQAPDTGKQWEITGELRIMSRPKPAISSETDSFETVTRTLDKAGNLFNNSSIELTIDDEYSLITLHSRQVKLILNSLGVVGHAKV